jgi:hypothetical protein
MTKLVPIILTIVLAGVAGFAAGRATSGLDARIAASGAAIAADEGCAALARGQWAIGAAGFQVEARAFGDDCTKATAVLVIGDANGPAYQAALPTAWVFGLADAQDSADMTTALSEWIAAGSARTTGELAAWQEGAEGPEGEFPFVPGENFDRPAYEDMRAANQPMFCFPQGMESMRCLRAVDTMIEEIGIQQFPG